MIEAIAALLFGLIVGSFLNVCIYRWPRDLSVVKPRSHCTSCEKTIAWYDNVPLLSYGLLGGRCRHCRARIPWRYPVVELLTGLLFFLFVLRLGPGLPAVKSCVFGALIVGLVFSDLEERILPDELTLGGTALGLAFSFLVPVPDQTASAFLWIAGATVPAAFQSPIESALGAVLPAAFLWGGGWLYEKLRHREGLGFGDVKLIAMVGSFLGLGGALLTLVLGSLTGSVLGLLWIKLKGHDPSTYELPFGTFLGVSAIVVCLAGRVLAG